MSWFNSRKSWRLGIVSVVTGLLLIISSLSIVQAEGAASAQPGAKSPQVMKPAKMIKPIRTGVLSSEMLKAPNPKDAPPHALPSLDPLTPAQRAAYEEQVRQNPRKDIGPPMTLRSSGGQSPNFVGDETTPLLVRSAEGLNATQTGCGQTCTFVSPNISVATDLSYVMEAVDSAVAIYRTSTGALAYGPYSGASFFAPVKQNGSYIFGFQTHYDTSRDRWI